MRILKNLYVWMAAVFVLLFLAIALPNRVGVTADSTQYLSSARSYAAGNGLMTIWWTGKPETLTHFPPLYPAVIGLLARELRSVETAALVLNLVLAPIIVLLMAVLAQEATSDLSEVFSQRAVTIAAVCGAIANHLLYLEAMALSEPLFIVFELVCFIALAKALKAHVANQALWIIGAMLAASVATLTRYVGVVVIGTMCLSILLLIEGSLWKRLVTSLLAGFGALLPSIVWSLRNVGRTGTASNRVVAFHPLSLSDVMVGMKTGVSWIIPESVPAFLRWPGLGVVLLALLAFVVVIRWYGISHRRLVLGGRSSILRALVIFVVAYPAFVVISICIADRSTDLDYRMLSPVLVIGIVLVGAWYERVLNFHFGSTLYRAAGVSLLGSYLVLQGAGLIELAHTARVQGLGLAQVSRKHPLFAETLRQLPDQAHVYSNMPFLFYYITGRVAEGLPHAKSPTSLRPNLSLGKELTLLRQKAVVGPTYLVVFDGNNDQFVVSETDLQKQVILDSIRSIPGGHIARVRPVYFSNGTLSQH